MASGSSISDYLLKGKEDIVGLKLPSVGDILAYFIFHNEKYFHKKQLKDIAKLTVKKAFEFYDKVEIPTHQHSVEKVLKLYDKYKALKQNRNTGSALQKKREDDFVASFDDLFDLSAPNAVNSLKMKPLTRDFLIKQQEKGRPGTMDAILAQKQRARDSGTIPDSSLSSSRVSGSDESSIAERDIQSISGSLVSISVSDDSSRDPDYVPKDTSTEETPPRILL